MVTKEWLEPGVGVGIGVGVGYMNLSKRELSFSPRARKW